MHALIDDQSIFITDGSATLIVAGSDPAYTTVRRYLVDGHGNDFDTVRDLVESVRVPVKNTVTDAFSAVDGDSDSDDDESPYRIVHGDPIEEVVFATAIRLARENADLAPLGEFLKRLERNPSQASRSQLFGWLKAGGFTLTEHGLIVGYKSVRSDGRSAHSGSEPVTVMYQDGTTETVTGHVPYPVGSVVWMPRDLVDDNRNSSCSVGLHVGTYSYAQTFSEQMLVVLIDPADVVSVPACSGAQKMRVCRLRVAALHDGEQISEGVIDRIRTVPDFEATEAYLARPENSVTPTFAIVDLDDEYGQDDEFDEADDGESDSEPEQFGQQPASEGRPLASYTHYPAGY